VRGFVEREITPIFSGGTGRSGTTIVGKMLRKHPDLLAGNPNEIKFITEVFSISDLLYGPRKFIPTQISKAGNFYMKLPLHGSIEFRFLHFRRMMLNHWWERTNRLGHTSGINRAIKRERLEEILEDFRRGLKDDPEVAARNFLFNYIQSHKKYSGERFWMDTTPPNIMYADYIYRLLPEAKFIEMRRHPLDTLASVLDEPWGPNELSKAIPWWRDRIKLADQALAHIPNENKISIRLEDLIVHKREESYRKILETIGLEDHPDMREFFETKMIEENANIGRWRQGFPDPDHVLAEFEKVAGEIAQYH